jgi:hypothetical protein
MTEDDLLERFGLPPHESALDEIRSILERESARERSEQGAGDTEVIRLCCAQLFSHGHTDDVLRIWSAKSASFDADISVDVQLLCGPGLVETTEFLRMNSDPAAAAALARIVKCECAGDFDDFDPKSALAGYRHYYRVT